MLTRASFSYAMLLGTSQSVEEHGRQGATVATTVVQACDTDASGGKVPALSAIESSTPAQKLAWMYSLCAVSQAKDTLQQLPAGLVLPAVAMRCPRLKQLPPSICRSLGCRYMVATTDADSPVPAWFIAGLTMAVLRPFNEEKVRRTEEVRPSVALSAE